MKHTWLFLLTGCLCILALPAQAVSVAITMDNPNTQIAPIYSPKERDEKILAALAKNHLQATLFAQGSQIESADGSALLNRWNAAGHTIGNHTYSHKSLNEIDVTFYENDTLKNEKLLQAFSHFKKIFRYPFLKEGDTAVKRDEFRQFLRSNGYLTGSVTIDTSDWYISDRLVKKLKENPQTDLAPYRKYYLEHVWSHAQYYDQLAVEILGRSPSHTLLVHHNLLNALFLADVIQMFRDKGWQIIDADEAFKDPVYQMQPDTVPAGESLIWALAKETGRYEDKLRYPGEDGSYEKEAMDALGL